MLTEQGTKVSGWTISSTVMEKNPGLMALSMKVSTSQERNMEEVSTVGTTGPSTMAIGKRTKSRDLERTPGWTEDSTRVNGSITTWTASAFTHGKMEGNTAVNTKTTRSTDMEFTLGQMVVHTLDTGAVESNTD